MPELPLKQKNAFGKTGLSIPPVVFGTSCLGNLYAEIPYETKLAILREIVANVEAPVVLDTAGKYGAGLALEMIGKGLRDLGVAPEDVVISNKLAWYRVPLETPEPTFEVGIWEGLENDAVQKISYEGIMECYEQGAGLLGRPYGTQVVSVHDPEEYLAADTEEERKARLEDMIGAYRALGELKAKGAIKAIGTGSKDWPVIKMLSETVELDWVMFACCLTIMRHPPELLDFMADLNARGVAMINSAVFHAGFLTGGTFFDYRPTDPANEEDKPLFEYRDKFNALCAKFGVKPSEACVMFGMSVPGVVATALNTGKPHRIKDNVASVRAEIPSAFWSAMKQEGLISAAYPYLG